MPADSTEALGATLAAVNALLNGSSAALLVTGRILIRGRRREAHGKAMVAAFAVSTVFLCVYLTRVYLTGTHKYPGDGLLKSFYYALLGTHMLLAALVPPLAIRALHLAWRRRFDEHKRVVRWAFPVWLYVSVTGVLVYLLLYQWA